MDSIERLRRLQSDAKHMWPDRDVSIEFCLKSWYSVDEFVFYRSGTTPNFISAKTIGQLADAVFALNNRESILYRKF